MSDKIQAIYENGMLRPLQPLELDEREVVSLSIQRTINGKDIASEREIAQQQVAVGKLLERLKRLPVRAPKDAFSNRDHDQVLYPKKP